jgi:virulence factor Mce-like protein
MSKSRSALRRCAGLVLGVAAVLGSASCGGVSQSHASGYCAIFSDSVGLYVGNPVTQMGYKIGTVNKITPSATSVQVDFSVTDTRPLPNDVKAVIRSASILADRTLELVGNYRSGPKLQPGQCVPLGRSLTPKSISQELEATNRFIKGISPQDSRNLGDTISQLDRATKHTGAGFNQLFTASSRLLDSPDGTISDLKSIVDNMALLTRTLIAVRDPLKQILNDAVITNPYVLQSMKGTTNFVAPFPSLIDMLGDIENHLGDEIQLTLDQVSEQVRIFATPHINGWLSALGGILKSTPWWINAIANHYNNTPYFSLFYRPPLYRIRTPDGPLVCAMMNGSNPGSCANVAGQPYGVDINLLQYVFMQANR